MLCSNMLHIPGLEGLNQSLTCVSRGGDDIDWKDFNERRFYTNAFIVSGGKVSQTSRRLICKAETENISNRCYWDTRNVDLVYTSAHSTTPI